MKTDPKRLPGGKRRDLAHVVDLGSGNFRWSSPPAGPTA